MVVPSSLGVSSSARRSSARLQKLEPKCYYTSPQKRITPASASSGTRKKSKLTAVKPVPLPAAEDRVAVVPASTEGNACAMVMEKPEPVPATDDRVAVVSASTEGNACTKSEQVPAADDCVAVVPASTEGNAYAMVTETIRKFNKMYLNFVQEEENRCNREVADRAIKPKAVGSKSKRVETVKEDVKRSSKRPDLKAISQMKKLNVTLYREKRIGCIPGVDVGHQFFSRAEMVVLGFHQPWLCGIDYVGATANRDIRQRLNCYKLPIAVSIVLSGQYEDDLDNCDEIVYTGQGGNNLLGDKRQRDDQELKRGNLGLKNSMYHSVPVRVTRGHKCRDSYVGKVYTYDGLYKVINYWAEKGVSGFTVYKFRLRRLDGQPPLTTDQVHFTRGGIPKSVSEIRGLISEDITGGLEHIPIPVTNLIDDEHIQSGFVYIKDLKFSKNITTPGVVPTGCNCRGACVDSRTCSCARLNGSDFPYVYHNGGRLVEPKAVVFECGPNCQCGPQCVNKTSQSGPKYRLEVFRTPRMGWGVRSWDYIPSGAPICEYIGLVRRTKELDPAADNTYVFDIDCLQTMKGLDGRESRFRDVSLPSHLETVSEEISENVPFCIDAAETGNVARFINHSCQPNLFVQCVLSNHHDMKLARVVLFAADNIPPLKELSYDYGYALDSVVGPDGNTRQMPCFCGARECRKRLY